MAIAFFPIRSIAVSMAIKQWPRQRRHPPIDLSFRSERLKAQAFTEKFEIAARELGGARMRPYTVKLTQSSTDSMRHNTNAGRCVRAASAGNADPSGRKTDAALVMTASSAEADGRARRKGEKPQGPAGFCFDVRFRAGGGRPGLPRARARLAGAKRERGLGYKRRRRAQRNADPSGRKTNAALGMTARSAVRRVRAAATSPARSAARARR